MNILLGVVTTISLIINIVLLYITNSNNKIKKSLKLEIEKRIDENRDLYKKLDAERNNSTIWFERSEKLNNDMNVLKYKNDELTVKLNAFQHRYKTNEVHSFVIDSFGR